MATTTNEKNQLTTLVAVSQALASTLHLGAMLLRVLELLERGHDIFPSIVTLLQGEAAELTIATAHGFSSRDNKPAIVWKRFRS